jgi:hypothetical protein
MLPFSFAYLTNSLQECQSGRAVLAEDDRYGVEALVRYMYHLDYDVPAAAGPPLTFYVTMSKLADKYLIQHLNDLSVEKFIEAAKAEPGSDAVAEAVRSLYMDGVTGSLMGKAVSSLLLKHSHVLDEPDEKQPATALRTLLETTDAFARDFAYATIVYKKAYKQKYPNERRYKHCRDFSFRAAMDDGRYSYYRCPLCGEQMSAASWRGSFVVEE